MSHRDPVVKHNGTVVNGIIEWDYPKVRYQNLVEFEGMRIEETITLQDRKATKSMFGYYFGGLISATLMKQEMFKGLTKEEIHQELMKELRPYQKEVNGVLMDFVDDIKTYKVEQMKLYIDDLLNWLGMHDIQPLSIDQYKQNKYSSTNTSSNE